MTLSHLVARRAVYRLQRHALPLIAVCVMSACANKPPAPDWQMNAQGATQKAIDAYLTGNTRVELLEWGRARAEVARTGRPDLLARLELIRCAARLGSLVIEPCTAFEALRVDAGPAEKVYADYLAGHVPAAQTALLPDAQRRAAAAGGAAALGSIEDPLSRLVAAGALFHKGQADPSVVQIAIDTSSAQGWRRPLLAWLALQAGRADAAGDTAASAALRRRMAIVEERGSALIEPGS